MRRIRNAKIMNMFSFNCHTDTLWTNFYYFQTNRKETEAQERVTSQSNLAKATEIVSYKAKSEINLWDTKTTLSLTCTEWSLTWEVWGNETSGKACFPSWHQHLPHSLVPSQCVSSWFAVALLFCSFPVLPTCNSRALPPQNSNALYVRFLKI